VSHAAGPRHELAVVEERGDELDVRLVNPGYIGIVGDPHVAGIDVVSELIDDLLDQEFHHVHREHVEDAADRHVAVGGVEPEVVVRTVDDG